MSSSWLRAAGTACFASAVLGALFLPSFVLTESRALQVAIPLVGLGLFAFFMLVFRRVLVERYAFRRANGLIPALIVGNAALAISSVLDEISFAFIPLSFVLVVGGCVVTGFSAALFGVRLWSIRSSLGALGVVFALLQVGVGISYATVYLIAGGIILSVFADIALGLILIGLSSTRLQRAPA